MASKKESKNLESKPDQKQVKIEEKKDEKNKVTKEDKKPKFSKFKAIVNSIIDYFWPKSKSIKPTLQPIVQQHVSDNEWFKKKYERDVGEIHATEGANLNQLEKFFKCQRILKCDIYTYLREKYEETILGEDIPEIIWKGPIMKKCGCPKLDCDCRGDMLLPSKFLPITLPYKWNPVYYYNLLVSFFKRSPEQPEQKTFAQRLCDSVNIEMDCYKKLRKAGLLENRGPEFCVYRCVYHYHPEAKPNYEYFKMKKKFFSEAKSNWFSPVPQVEIEVESFEEEKEETVQESESDDALVDGYYTTRSTQATTGPDGEFIMGKISHLLFGRSKPLTLCDLDGKKLSFYLHDETSETEDKHTVTNLKTLFTVKGMKCRLSKLRNDFLSSVIEIKDTGIPMNTQATQDPPLDDYYQSIVEIASRDEASEGDFHDEKTCPCCEYYRNTCVVDSDILTENNSDITLKNTDRADSFNAPESNKDGTESIAKDIEKTTLDKNLSLQITDSQPVEQFSRNDEVKQYYSIDKIDEANSNNIKDEISTAFINKRNKLQKINKIVELKDRSYNRITTKIDNAIKINESFKDFQNKVMASKEQEPQNNILNFNNETNINIKGSLVQYDENKYYNILKIRDSSVAELTSNNFLTSTSEESKNTVVTNNPVNSGKIDTHIDKMTFEFQSTQKPSQKFIPYNKTQRTELKEKRKTAFSYENIKLHVKKSFQKTSSAFTSCFIKSVNFISNLKNSKDLIKTSKINNNNLDSNDESKDSDNQDLQISEKEIFSLQYNKD